MFVNVSTIQGGYMSITAAVTFGVTGYMTGTTIILWVVYTIRTEPIWEEHYAMNRPDAA